MEFFISKIVLVEFSLCTTQLVRISHSTIFPGPKNCTKGGPPVLTSQCNGEGLVYMYCYDSILRQKSWSTVAEGWRCFLEFMNKILDWGQSAHCAEQREEEIERERCCFSSSTYCATYHTSTFLLRIESIHYLLQRANIWVPLVPNYGSCGNFWTKLLN